MSEYDVELQQGHLLASVAAAASNELDAQVTRIGATHPVAPDSRTAAVDAVYIEAYHREVAASQAFWAWVKEHSAIVTDHDLGQVLRVLSGQSAPTDVEGSPDR